MGEIGDFPRRKIRASTGGNTLVDEFTSLTTISSRDVDERCLLLMFGLDFSSVFLISFSLSFFP